jgi:hypothetical protein
MEMNKKSNRLITKFFLFGTVLVLLSSCAREKASWSYQNEKLRKQSLEIENSVPSVALNTEKPEETSNVPAEVTTSKVISPVVEKTAVSEPSNLKNAEGKKLSPVEKIAIKKLAKKMNPEDLEKVKRGGMDQNLRYALIFGVVGLALCVLGWVLWPLYLLGVIAIVVGLVFLVLWLLEQ